MRQPQYTNGKAVRCHLDYHHHQFRVSTAFYHITKHEIYHGISQSSVAFVEFMLRKIHDRIFNITPDFNHWNWYGSLYGNIMQAPYNMKIMNIPNLAFYDTARTYFNIFHAKNYLCKEEDFEIEIESESLNSYNGDKEDNECMLQQNEEMEFEDWIIEQPHLHLPNWDEEEENWDEK